MSVTYRLTQKGYMDSKKGVRNNMTYRFLSFIFAMN